MRPRLPSSSARLTVYIIVINGVAAATTHTQIRPCALLRYASSSDRLKPTSTSSLGRGTGILNTSSPTASISNAAGGKPTLPAGGALSPSRLHTRSQGPTTARVRTVVRDDMDGTCSDRNAVHAGSSCHAGGGEGTGLTQRQPHNLPGHPHGAGPQLHKHDGVERVSCAA